VSISYKDDDDFKREAMEEFSKVDSTIHGLIATDILTKGFDQADVMIGISARPFTKSFSSHVQQMGRVMRPHSDKSAAIWLDHSGNFLRFRRKWEDLYRHGVECLSEELDKPTKDPTDKEKEASKCPRCGQIWPMDADVCPHCGMVRTRRNDVRNVDGVMQELGAEVEVKEKYDSTTKERWYQELVGVAREKGYADGWAFHKYKEKFGIEPAWKKVAATPTMEVRNWITSRNIAWAHRK